MFLNGQGYGRLLMAVSQELNAILTTRNQYVTAMQAPYAPQPPVPAPQPPSSAPVPSPSGPDDVLTMLAGQSAEQDKFRRRIVGDCVYCGKPTRGNLQCPHCGRDQ